MKVGILADIHEHVDYLRSAVAEFEDFDVDQIVVLGDVFENGRHIDETVQILREVGAVGVWGNHELGLCHEPDPQVTKRFDTQVVEFFGSLQSTYELKTTLFCHGIPTWDLTDPTVYYLSDPPWHPHSLQPVFEAFPYNVFLTGHYHRWLMATTTGPTIWNGSERIVLERSQRYFIVVHAVLCGWCAILDTDNRELIPRFIG